jgi:predicted regulator of amino acid metabolism with ACT domain
MAYVVRTCEEGGKSYKGFQWNLEIGGITACEDWNPDMYCGGGLHGFLNGEGNKGLIIGPVWMILEVDDSEIIKHCNKCKFKSAKTIWIGDLQNVKTELNKLLGKDTHKYKFVFSDDEIKAQSHNLSEIEQLELAENEDELVRIYLAENPSITEKVQDLLAKDDLSVVRIYLAENPSITENVQLKLATDEKENVREWLTQNINIKESVQMILANDKSIYIRLALANNAPISESVREVLKNKI